MNSGIIMPPEKKVVDIRKGAGEPSADQAAGEPGKVDISQLTVPQIMRKMAEDMEAGNISTPQFICMLNGFENGQLHTYVIGKEMSRVELVGVLTTVSNRASLGG